MPQALAQQLRRHGVDALTLGDWRQGSYRTAPDDEILLAARAERRALVTYDCRTIPSLLKEWAEVGHHYAGVILIDEKTLQARDVGGLLRALLKLVEQAGDDDWEDAVVYLET